MNDNVFNAIDNYYKLKQKYEQQLENKKKPVRNNNDLTKKEKYLKLMRKEWTEMQKNMLKKE